MADGFLSNLGNWAAVPGYWMWALGIATAFYVNVRWFGAHLSPEIRDTLALWLMGAAESSWTRQFCALFDRVFGRRHFTVSCFIRSSIASILTVFALYLLFGPIFGFLEVRTETGMVIWQALLIGAAVNILPDYLSLLETRWLLKQMDRVRSVAGQVVVLALDLAFSAAIIWTSITLFLLATGQELLSSVEMLALFSAYSIFFYSSFFTSIWSWVYCLSTWFLRLFTRTPLGRVLNVERDPVSQVAFVGSGVVLAGAFALTPVVAPDPGADGGQHTVNRFDEWLCRRFPDDACPHVVRLSPADEEGRLAFIHSICEGQAREFCVSEAARRVGVSNGGVAKLLLRACMSGEADGCDLLVLTRRIWADEEEELEEELEEALTFLNAISSANRDVCESGVARRCFHAAFEYEVGFPGEQDLSKAADFYRQACEGGEALGCSSLGEFYVRGEGVGQDDDRAAALFGQACEGGIARACADLAAMHVLGRGPEQDPVEVAALSHSACEAREALACFVLGHLFENGEGVGQDDDRAAALFGQACELGLDEACDARP